MKVGWLRLGGAMEDGDRDGVEKGKRREKGKKGVGVE